MTRTGMLEILHHMPDGKYFLLVYCLLNTLWASQESNFPRGMYITQNSIITGSESLMFVQI